MKPARVLCIVLVAAATAWLSSCKPAPKYTVTITGAAGGTVTLNPPGGTYSAGTVVTLTAIPDNADGFFHHWEGGLTGSQNPATITVSASVELSAVFRVKFSYEVSPSVVPIVASLPTPTGGVSPVEASLDPKGVRSDFIGDEIVISPANQPELDQFLASYGGTVIGDNSVPEPPPHKSANITVVPMDTAPTSFTVRVANFPDAASFAAESQQRGLQGRFLYSSEAAVKLMAIASHEKLRGLRVSPNFVFTGHGMLHSTQERPLGGGTHEDAMSYGPYHSTDTGGSSRATVYKAWQFMEAAGYVQWWSVPLVVIDGGFWLNPSGAPNTSPSGIGTDLDTFVYQYDFYEKDYFAGGANPNVCSGGGSCPWHGNSTAGVSSGLLNNQGAAAGSGGQVADPYLFRVRLTQDQIDWAIRTAIHWGAKVINMSYGGSCNDDCMDYYDYIDFFDHMQAAYNAGIVLVASAGNDTADTAASNVFPCCIPGVICVGALDSYKDTAISYSNYGGCVDIWADTNVPAMPNGGTPNNLVNAGGTSASSPLVAGVAAMMKRINPALNSDGVLALLQSTAYKQFAYASPDPKVSPVGYLNAGRAVMAAADNKIFDDIYEPNDTTSQATPISPGFYPDLTLNPGKWDYYSFSLSDYGSIDFMLEYMAPLSYVSFNLTADTPGTVLGGVASGGFSTGYHYGAHLVPPGNYKLLLSAYNPQLYYMNFSKSESGLGPDAFEVNNTFAAASDLGESSDSYELTLHQHDGSDVDYFKFQLPTLLPGLTGKEYSVTQADVPVTAQLLDADTTAVINTQTGKDISFLFQADSSGKKYVLKVSGGYTRYVLDVYGRRLDKPWVATLPYDPFWWEDPLGPDIRNILTGEEDWLVVLGPRGGLEGVRMLGEGLSISLYDKNAQLLGAGTPVYGGQVAANLGNRKIGENLDTAAMTFNETYLLRVYRTPAPEVSETSAIASVKANMPYTLQSAVGR